MKCNINKSKPCIAIVIPARNEAANILPLLRSIQKNIKNLKRNANFTIVIIDDASIDNTAGIVQKLKDKVKPTMDITLLHKPQSTGIGGAYIFAFKKIIRGTLGKNFDYILQMDADLQHDPKYIKNFIQAAKSNHDIVISSRYIKNGSAPNWNPSRKYLSKCGNIFIKTLLGSKITDWTGGYNLYKTSVIKKIDLNKLPHNFCFQLALKSAALNVTQNVAEIPIIFRERKLGQSKMNWSVAVSTTALAFRLRLSKPKPFGSKR